MKTINLMALYLGAALFTGIGATSLMAGDGPGKCGTSMPKAQGTKCGDGKGMKPGKCGSDKNTSTKCGGKKKAPAKGKCGAGKCG